MKLLSKKLLEALFGQVGRFEGGTPVRAQLEYPILDGSKKICLLGKQFRADNNNVAEDRKIRERIRRIEI